MLFAYRGGFYPQDDKAEPGLQLQSAIVAQTTSSLTYRLTEDFGLLGICLYPFSIPYLMGINGPDFIDRFYAPVELFNACTPKWILELKLSESHNARIALISEIIQPYIDHQPQPEPAIVALIRSLFHAQEMDSLKELATPSNISSRHLQRQVKRYTGYTPKKLLRILRLQLTMSEQLGPALSELATKTDYYDQSHLTNEFRQLTGTTPKDHFINARADSRWRQQGEEVAFFQSTAGEGRYPVTKSNQENDDGND
jgi:AraC-like DNA-binding protein